MDMSEGLGLGAPRAATNGYVGAGHGEQTMQSLPLPPGAPQGSNPMPHNQTPGHPSFRRQRASRACSVSAAAFSLVCLGSELGYLALRAEAPRRDLEISIEQRGLASEDAT